MVALRRKQTNRSNKIIYVFAFSVALNIYFLCSPRTSTSTGTGTTLNEKDLHSAIDNALAKNKHKFANGSESDIHIGSTTDPKGNKKNIIQSSLLGIIESLNIHHREETKRKHKRFSDFTADCVWRDILYKGEKVMQKNNYSQNLVVFEVGAQILKQSADAARAKFHAFCIEPSPMSYQKMTYDLNKSSKNEPLLGEYIHLYNAAAGSTSGEMLDFHTTGGTGDHVGEYDVWNMKAGKVPDDFPASKKGKIVQVPSLKLDDMIFYNKMPNDFNALKSNPPKIDDVWALKVDTQGFEPQVFAGLKESIQHRKIQYIMTEYWPNGMGLLNNRADKCELATEMISSLVSAGYTLYALPVVAHASVRGRGIQDAMHHWEDRPLHDLKADCEFFLNLEKRFPNEEYHMGYWTDYLAVAPGADPIVLESIK